MSETKIIPSIITSKDADQLNTKLQSELAAHLFLFCHYSPIPENPQSKYARFVPGILNLYIFSTDACFYLKNLNELLIEYKIYKDGNIPSAIYAPAKHIYYIVREIAQLRTAIAHNGTSESEEYYQNWIKGVIKKYPASTIEVFSRKYKGIYERQLRNAYRDKTSNDNPKWSDLENWIEDSVGYRFRCQIDELTSQIATTENKISTLTNSLKQIETILELSGDDDKQRWIQHKNSVQKEIDELKKQKNEEEKLQNEQKDNLNNKLSQMEDYKQNGKKITSFFYDHLAEQLSQTLKELKEKNDTNFTLFPEYFIREDIERNFPPLY